MIIKKATSLFLYLLCFLILVPSIPSETYAKIPDEKQLHYVALGDSLAAGWTVYENGPDKGEGYPELIAARFEQSNYDISLKNFAKNGYTTFDVLEDLRTKENIRKEVEEADILTIDAGANDLLGQLARGEQADIEGAITSAAANMRTILATITEWNPDIKVYVMGYYNAIEQNDNFDLVKPKLIQMLHEFNASLYTISMEAGANFVPTFKIIEKDYDTYLPTADVHLSLEGYKAIAKEFWKKMAPRHY